VLLALDQVVISWPKEVVYSRSRGEPDAGQFAFDDYPGAYRVMDGFTVISLACHLIQLDRMCLPLSIVASSSTARSSVPEPVW
jgi:hypothetical protein